MTDIVDSEFRLPEKVSSIPDEWRRSVHKQLHRQECRLWLLGMGIFLLMSCARLEANGPFEDFAVFSFAAVGVVLVFWAGLPGQRILQQLREEGAKDETKEIEQRFNDSWQSVWDFLPPVLLPMALSATFFVYRFWKAAS